MPTNIESFVKTLESEGVDAGKKAAKKIEAEAREKAGEITAEAKEKADQIIAEAQAEAPPELRLAPGVGEDACAIAVDAGVLVAATDPITMTGEGVGAHAVWINANDVAATGVRPRWFLATVLLPIGTTEGEVRARRHETSRRAARVAGRARGAPRSARHRDPLRLPVDRVRAAPSA